MWKLPCLYGIIYTNKLKRQHWITIPQQDMKQYLIHYNTRHSNLDINSYWLKGHDNNVYATGYNYGN